MPEWTKWVVVGFACWRLLADAVMTITRIHYNGRISLVDCHNLCETSVYGHGLEYRLWLYDQHMIKMMFKFFHLCLKMIAWQIKRLNLTILTIFYRNFPDKTWSHQNFLYCFSKRVQGFVIRCRKLFLFRKLCTENLSSLGYLVVYAGWF